MSMPTTTHADTSSAERDTHAVSNAPSSDPSSTAAAASNGCGGGRVKKWAAILSGVTSGFVIGRDYNKHQPQTFYFRC